MSVFCDGLLGMRCAGLCPLLYRIRCMRPFVSDPQPAWDRFCSALCSCGDRVSRAFCLHETGSSHLFTKVNKKSQCALSGHFICRKNAFPIPFFISFNRCAPGAALSGGVERTLSSGGIRSALLGKMLGNKPSFFRQNRCRESAFSGQTGSRTGQFCHCKSFTFLYFGNQTG